MADKITIAKIREMHISGKTKREIQDELGVTYKTVWNALDYLKQKGKDAPKSEGNQSALYLDRDNWLMTFYASLYTKAAISASHVHDLVSTYKGR